MGQPIGLLVVVPANSESSLLKAFYFPSCIYRQARCAKRGSMVCRYDHVRNHVVGTIVLKVLHAQRKSEFFCEMIMQKFL
jgi:hypothetical protein